MLHVIENSISIFTGLLGFLVVFLIAFSYRSNSLMNIYLILSFLIVSIRLFHNGVSGFYTIEGFNAIISLITPFFLGGIPSFYLYFQKLFFHNNRFRKRDLLHFIFPIALFLFFLLEDLFSEKRNPLLFKYVIVSVLIFLIGYTLITVRLVILSLWLRKDTKLPGSAIQQKLLRKWSSFLILALSIGSLRLILSILHDFLRDGSTLGYTFTATSGILWLITFLMILLNPEILYGYEKLQRHLTGISEPAQNSNEELWESNTDSISNNQDKKLFLAIADKLPSYCSKIEALVAEQKPFSNKKYAIKDLAQDLKIPVSHLSFVFKYHCKLSFTEFKNYSRVNHALELIENKFLDSKTFEALADTVGFATYNTFFICFKQYTGTAPKDFYLEG